MANKAELVRRIALEADTATLLEADSYAVKFIAGLNKINGLAFQKIVQAGKFQVDSSGRIKLSVQNIANLERSMAAISPLMSSGISGLSASLMAGFAKSSVDFGVKIFQAQMQAAEFAGGAGFRAETLGILEQVAKARQIVYAKSLQHGAAANVQSAILGAFRDRVNYGDLPGIIQQASGVNESLAKTIARSETFANYRTANTAMYEATGFEYYEYMGPLDDTTSDICEAFVGKIKTRDKWLKLKYDGKNVGEYIFEYGLHPNCRHSLVGVQKEWMDESEWKAKLADAA